MRDLALLILTIRNMLPKLLEDRTVLSHRATCELKVVCTLSSDSVEGTLLSVLPAY